jgi:hypothetical protein
MSAILSLCRCSRVLFQHTNQRTHTIFISPSLSTHRIRYSSTKKQEEKEEADAFPKINAIPKKGMALPGNIFKSAGVKKARKPYDKPYNWGTVLKFRKTKGIIFVALLIIIWYILQAMVSGLANFEMGMSSWKPMLFFTFHNIVPFVHGNQQLYMMFGDMTVRMKTLKFVGDFRGAEIYFHLYNTRGSRAIVTIRVKRFGLFSYVVTEAFADCVDGSRIPISFPEEVRFIHVLKLWILHPLEMLKGVPMYDLEMNLDKRTNRVFGYEKTIVDYTELFNDEIEKAGGLNNLLSEEFLKNPIPGEEPSEWINFSIEDPLREPGSPNMDESIKKFLAINFLRE